jgi:hypothetical protein
MLLKVVRALACAAMSYTVTDWRGANCDREQGSLMVRMIFEAIVASLLFDN